MDWALALRRNREGLVRLLAVLFAAIGVVPGQVHDFKSGAGPRLMLSKAVRLFVLSMLRPIEAATRRLVVVEARGLEVAPGAARAAPAQAIPKGDGTRLPTFPLFDSLKRFETAPKRPRRPEPRISFPGLSDPVFVHVPKPSPDDPIESMRLLRRLCVIDTVLHDLPRHARRLARWRSAGEKRKPRNRIKPMRPGWPPGYRRRAVREVDDILRDCQILAQLAWASPDTS